MLAFIESIITLLVKLIFVDEIAKENEELKKEIQQLKQEKEEIAQAKQQLAQNNQDLIQQNFNLVQKYIAVNKQKDELIKELDRSKFPDINQEFDPEDWNIIDQLVREFNCTDSLTI
ncbi:MAG: hypothetical protein QNJ41_12575 [Xenococcaceae cyanobacterium MO_188.B32]|nr:hypothetical protein [Xenococcaceae cyanobacterium MO_188.B32]